MQKWAGNENEQLITQGPRNGLYSVCDHREFLLINISGENIENHQDRLAVLLNLVSRAFSLAWGRAMEKALGTRLCIPKFSALTEHKCGVIWSRVCAETTDPNFFQNLILSNRKKICLQTVLYACYLILLTSTTRIELSPESMV